MACFLVPTAEAIVATAITAAVRKKEEKSVSAVAASEMQDTVEGKLPFSRKLKWLTNLLWGGSALLAFEHVWHGEVTPWFPFLTAAGSPTETAAMLREMAMVGTAMAAAITAVWVVMLLVTSAMEKRPAAGQISAQ